MRQEETQLEIEVNHIFESGANEIRIIELINREKRKAFNEALEESKKEFLLFHGNNYTGAALSEAFLRAINNLKIK